jgi:hypothetical protein
MSAQNSYTKLEREVAPALRDKLNHAESAEEAKRFFAQEMGGFLQQVFGDELRIRDEDILLTPEQAPYFALRGDLAGNALIASTFKGSDLDEILQRLAQTAAHRYTHLAGHPAKTEAKIRR